MNALRTVLSAFGTAAAHPRVWLTAYVLVTVPAVLCVYPVVAQMHDALGVHPGASYTVDQALDADFARHHPDAVVRLGGASVFVLLAFAFLGGGILAGVGVGKRFSYTELLADGGRLLVRNLRVLLIGLVACLLLFWGVGHLDRLIRSEWVYEWDTGPVSVFGWRTPWLSLEMGLEALSWLWGFLFLLAVFLAKMAMARLAAADRRSALTAWLRATGTALRHPLRTAMVVLLWLAIWMAGAHAFGMLTNHFLEVRRELWIGLAAGQAGMLWTQIALVAAFLAARRVAVADVVIVETTIPPDDDLDRS